MCAEYRVEQVRKGESLRNRGLRTGRNPATNTWTALPTAPGAQFGDTAVWAGDRLLEWGLGGLQFGP